MPDSLRPQFGNAEEPPFTRALRNGGPNHRFADDLEADYERGDLAAQRGLIRTTCTCALVIALWHSAEQLLAGRADPVLLVELGMIVGSSLGLAALAWSPIFEHHYQPSASVLVPVRDVVAFNDLVRLAAHGSPVVLMALPLMIGAAFFLLGLRLRTAILCGALCLASFALSAAYYPLGQSIAIRAGLLLFTVIIGSAIGRRQLERRSRASFLERGLMSEMAQHDPLTGALNRRAFDDQLARTWHDAAIERQALAIILIDVDHFKMYNDRYGHLAGDDTLRRVASALQSTLRRPRDLLARYGGEEFAAILFDTTGSETRALAERMRSAVMDLGIEHLGSPTADVVTISVGAATVEPTLLREYRGAVQLADQALYLAKMRGRNGVELHDNAQYQLLVTGVFVSPRALAKATGRSHRRASA